MSEPLTLYKLIILYMLEKVDFPLTNSQLSEFILEKEYTTYFTLQTAISDLLETELISADTTHKNSLYTITSSGRETLDFFNNKISDAIKEDIDTFLAAHHYELRNESSVITHYYKTPNGEYAAQCQVKERKSNLIDLTLTVPTKQEALTICEHWKAHSQEIYAYLIQKLL